MGRRSGIGYPGLLSRVILWFSAWVFFRKGRAIGPALSDSSGYDRLPQSTFFRSMLHLQLPGWMLTELQLHWGPQSQV